MSAVLAGITAWVIEVAVAIVMILGLKHEENKVIKRRQQGKKNGE
tara:strand:- start:278 stop:412 length:135 start_codon:yes stop_codon:yes gene_type:complete